MPGICPRCQQKVYFAEEVRCQGSSWHKSCMKCENCRKQLDSSNLSYHTGCLYCSSCYRKLFGPRGYGFGGVMSEEEFPTSVLLKTTSRDKFFTPPPSLGSSNDGQNGGERVWVSPRLVKSAGKLLDNSNFQLIKSMEAQYLREKNSSSCSSIGAKSSSSRGFKQLSREVIDQSRSSSSKPYCQSNLKSTSAPTFTPFNNNNWNSRRNLLPKNDIDSPKRSDPQLVLRKAFNIPSSSKSMTSTSSNGMTSSSKPPPKVCMKAKLPISFSPLSKIDLCHKCNKQVFQAEKFRAAGNVWHKTCFTCNLCSSRLDSNRLCERGGQIFCNNCYHKNFGPRGIGYGIGANFQT